MKRHGKLCEVILDHEVGGQRLSDRLTVLMLDTLRQFQDPLHVA